MRILVVEDEINLNGLITEKLKDNHYGVDSCFDGKEALEYISMVDYDVIILDVMLPEMDGFEVCRQIRDKVRVPIVMVTARLDDIDKIRGLGVGADDYIEKPFSPSVLIAKIKAMLAQYKRLTERDAMETNAIQSGEIRLDPR